MLPLNVLEILEIFVPVALFLNYRHKHALALEVILVKHDLYNSAFADKATDCAIGKPVGGSSLEEVELRGGQEVSHLPAPCSGCPIPRVKPWNFF